MRAQRRTLAGVTAAQVLALGIPFFVVMQGNPGIYAGLFATALIVAIVSEALFAVIRKRGISFHGVTTAMIVTVMVPTDLPLWQLAFVVSLGVILGELIFGGRGFGFLSPVTVAMSLLVFSFPQAQLPDGTQALAIATAPGAALLLFLGLISWRVIFGTMLGISLILALNGQDIDPTAIGNAVTFGLIFLICDPTAATVTNAGRWIYGLLAGGLIVVFSTGAVFTSEAVVFAALLASIFAPLIDHLVVLAHARRRKLSHA